MAFTDMLREQGAPWVTPTSGYDQMEVKCGADPRFRCEGQAGQCAVNCCDRFVQA